MLNECGQLWASRAAQALDARLTNHVVYPSVNPALDVTSTYFYTVIFMFYLAYMDVFFNLPISKIIHIAIYIYIYKYKINFYMYHCICG